LSCVRAARALRRPLAALDLVADDGGARQADDKEGEGKQDDQGTRHRLVFVLALLEARRPARAGTITGNLYAA